MNFFTNFPRLQYNNLIVTNITLRIIVANLIMEKDWNLFPYKIKSDDRPDVLAYKYYEDSHLDWVILLLNNMFDPLYDWPLTNENLNKYIENKYGSINQARSKILFYRDSEGYNLDEESYTNLEDEYKQIIYAYEYEVSLNEAKRDIKLLDKDKVNILVKQLDTILNKKNNEYTYYKNYNKDLI